MGNLAALTFDDGFVDNLLVLVPLLSSWGIPATVFVVSGWFGQRHPDAPWTRSMERDELRSVRRAGLEVGGHSTRHMRLSGLTRSQAEADMRACRTELEATIEQPVTVFAYPYGDATEETRVACSAAGYRAACRCGGVGDWSEPFNLPRQDMQNRDSAIGLRLKRDNRYEPIVRTRPGLALRRGYRLLRYLGS